MSFESAQTVTLSSPVEYEADFIRWEQELSQVPLVVEARDLAIDRLLQKKAESLVGSLAVDQSVVVEHVASDEKKQPMSLHVATELAAEGDPDALRMLGSNAISDYIERSYKKGFFCPPIELEKDADGNLTQNGQSLEEVHTNTVQYMTNEKLKERAKTVELLNSVRDQHYSREGLLKDNVRLIVSLVHDQMSDAEAADAGFFVPTRSVAFQLLTEHEGKTIIQVAFFTTKDDESGVFDLDAIVNFAKKLNVNYEGAGSEEIIGRPMLISKDVVPDLIVSVAEMFDESATEVTGVQRFLGEASDTQQTTADYKKKFEECQEISANMQADIDTVVAKLIASKPASPTEATEKLAELNDQLVKARIITDSSIDARVLGVDRAYYVEHARYLYQQDPQVFINQQRDMNILQRQINRGQTNSCPGGSRTKNTFIGHGDLFDGAGDQDKNDFDEVVEDCKFPLEQCPNCNEKNIIVTCRKGKYYGSCGCVSD